MSDAYLVNNPLTPCEADPASTQKLCTGATLR